MLTRIAKFQQLCHIDRMGDISKYFYINKYAIQTSFKNHCIILIRRMKQLFVTRVH